MVEIDPNEDYYSILGVEVDAAPGQIRQAYRQLVRLHHPDTGHGDVEKFRRIRDAYNVLYDATIRSAYDHQRLSRGYGGTGSLALTILQSQHSLIPMDQPQMLYASADIQPQDRVYGGRKSLNLALVVDTSTSMQGARLHSLKIAANDLIEFLNPVDRLAIVTFNDRAELLVSGSMSQGKQRFRSAIAAMMAGGGTEICKGLTEGIQQILPHVSAAKVSHVIMLTDGRTYGDEAEALDAATRAAAAGIGISACGIGEDWNDLFLDDLARRGGGTAQYIDRPSKVQQVLKSQIKSLTNTALRNVKVRVSASPGIDTLAAFRVSPYMEILDIQPDSVFSIGNLMSGESCVLAIEFAVHVTETGLKRLARIVVEGDDVTESRSVQLWRDLSVSFTRTPEDKPVPSRLLNILARLSVFRLQEKAWGALTSGEQDQAERFLESAATRLFDLGYRELGQAAMLEVSRMQRGQEPSLRGRKRLRYGTRSLSIPSS